MLRSRVWFPAFLVLAAASIASAQTPSAAPAAGPSSSTPTTSGAAPQAQTPASTPSSPLSIHVGDADLTLGGFMDATSVTRSTDTGAGLGTGFASIPFSNVQAGSLAETRFSTQNSRITLGATSKVGGWAIKGYTEADFLGNAATNIFVTSNSNTLRMRLYWVDANSGSFEFLAGQSWSLMTPGRNGISPNPSDIFYSQDVDTNYQMGLAWGRTTQFRFIAHPSKTIAAGVSLENPQQYVGGVTTLPAAFTAAEVENGANTATPNVFPDVIGKIAFDPKTGNTHQHIEFAGLFSDFKTDMAAATAGTFTNFTAKGKGGSANVNLEPVKNLHLIFTSFFSNGGGRYIANTSFPDFIVNADGSMTLVKSHSVIGGIEAQVMPKTLFYGYYSQAKANQALTVDTGGKSIGYGVAGANGANQTLQESTVGLTQVFFKDPKIGAMQMMIQVSYLKRTPFSVPAGTPTFASAKMFFFNIRYVLP